MYYKVTGNIKGLWKGYQEALNDNGNALKGNGEAFKGDGNTLPSHFNIFVIVLMPFRRIFCVTPLQCNGRPFCCPQTHRFIFDLKALLVQHLFVVI